MAFTHNTVMITNDTSIPFYILHSLRQHVVDLQMIALPPIIQLIFKITRKTKAVQREIDRDDDPLDTLEKA